MRLSMQAEMDIGSKELLSRLVEYIKDIRFGSVSIIIQDGKIIQIEKNEKIRLR